MSDKNKIHVLSRAVIIDKANILLCKTCDLENNFYFLPGGHIEHGESAAVALLRELVEETGVVCSIKRFLGCLEYSFEPEHSSICHNHEYNFVFEVTSDFLKIDNKTPKLETHIELLWMPFHELSKIDFRAEPLRTLLPKWLQTSENNYLHSVMI